MNRQVLIDLILQAMPSRDLCLALAQKQFMEPNSEGTGHQWRRDVVTTVGYQELLLVYSMIREDLQLSGLIREMALIQKAKES